MRLIRPGRRSRRLVDPRHSAGNDVFEHRRAPHRRHLALHLIGE